MKLILLLAVALPACAQVCPYAFSPPAGQTINIAADASTLPNTINVSALAGCNWLYSANVPWISFPNQPLLFGSGTGTISWLATVNLGPNPRIATITVNTVNGAVLFPVVQAAPVCTLTLNPSSANVPLGGGTGSFQEQTNCTWVAQSQSSFVSLTSAASGSLNATMNYSVPANRCVAARTGTIAVQAGGVSGPLQTFQISQVGSPDNLTLTPSSAAVSPAALSGTLAIATDSSCPWSAYSDVSWLAITSSTSGSGNATLSYQILANTSAQRTGSIHVGLATFTVTQQAVPGPAVTIAAVANGADYAQGAVSPGEIVAIFGSSMGPVAGAVYQLTAGGSLPAALGNTQVFFDSTAAPLLYSSSGQVNAVVPYGVNGSTKVQVNYAGSLSNVLALQVQPATPGILTLDRSGTGGGAILNQDLSVNSPGNPATAGSVVVIYCVGGGATNPASADGAVIGVPAPTLVQTATVTVGGVNAPVQYSGAVSYSVAGLTQINALIPASLTAHGQLPVFVTIGGVQSQGGVTVAIQ